MTRAKILAMTPGRHLDQLDAAVARQIFGWKRIDWDSVSLFGIPLDDDDESLSVAGNGFYHVPRYSTEIAAAWLIFKDCCDMIFSKRSRFFHELGELLQRQLVSYPDRPKVQYVAWPDAMMYLDPEKICKAALLSEISE